MRIHPTSAIGAGALATLCVCLAGCRPGANSAPTNSPPVKPLVERGTAPDQGTETDTAAAPEATAVLPAVAWMRDHDKAFAEAKRLRKPVLIDFWCGT